MTVLGVVSGLSASETPSFLYTSCLFNWGEFRQGNSVHIHSVRIVVRVRWEVCLGGNSSFLQGEDVHLLSVKDLRPIHPSLDSSRDGGCYNPFSSSFYFTFHSYSLSTYLEG